MIFKVQRIVLSSVSSQPSWCLGPRFRGALYLRSRRSSKRRDGGHTAINTDWPVGEMRGSRSTSSVQHDGCDGCDRK